MTPDDRKQFNEILSHGSMLNVSEQFLVDLVVKLEAEVNQALLGVIEALDKYSIEQQRKHQAIAALRTVLARIRWATMPVGDWLAPDPSRDDIDPATARQAQYPGRLEDWLEQTIAGLE
jgi:hypothetical protein